MVAAQSRNHGIAGRASLPPSGNALAAWGAVAALFFALAPRANATSNTYYFRNIPTDIANYDTFRPTEAITNKTNFARSVTETDGGTDDLDYAFVGPAIGTGTLPAGDWTMNLYANAPCINVGNSTPKVYVFTRTLGGVENLLFTSSYDTDITCSGTGPWSWIFTVPTDTPVNATDRIVVYVYAAQPSGGVKVLGDVMNFWYDSTGRKSRITTAFDIVAPNPVNLSSAAVAGVGSVQINWRSPGNDGALQNLLAGSEYYIQYSTYVVAWATANAQIAIPITASLSPNTAQSRTVSNLVGGATYFFVLWTADESLNFSVVSSTIGAIPGQPPSPGNSPPGLTAVYASSATAQWTANGNPAGTIYNLLASADPTFSSVALTSSTQNTSATVSGLTPGTSYFFEVDAVVGLSSSVYLALPSSTTIPAPPAAQSPAFTMVGVTSVTVQWSDPLNPANANYTVNASTAADFTGTLFSSATANQSATITGLSGRTTYYFEVNASTNGRTGSNFVLGSTTTLVAPPGLAASNFTAVYVTSASVRWTSGGNPAGTIYNLQASTAPDFSGTQVASATANTSAILAGLSTSTVYFFQVDAVVTGASSAFVSLGSTVTQPSPPLVVAPTFPMVSVSSITAQWGAGTNGPAAQYDLQASSSSNFTGLVVSSATTNASATATNLLGLTVYYFQVRTRTASGVTAYVSLGSTKTLNNLAVAPGAASPTFLWIGVSSAAAQWTAGGNPPGAVYTLQASTAPDFSGTVFSSATAGLSAVVSGLRGNTTYFYQVQSTVGGGNAYASLGSTVTMPDNPIVISPVFTQVNVTSMTVQWSPATNAAATVYQVNASTTANFGPPLSSSSTANAFATLTGLTLNTTYYVQVRATGYGNAGAYVTLGSTITYPAPPGNPSSTFTAVNVSSVAAQWTANGNGGGVVYTVQASTASDFSGAVLSSTTVNLSAVVSGLSGYSTYFFQVSASTNGYLSSYTPLGSTITRPSAPGQAPITFSPIYITSVTIAWTSAGDGPGTQYNLQASTASDFTGTLFTYSGVSLSATLAGLAADTLYYFHVNAQGNGSSSAFTSLGSTMTRVNPPGKASPSFTASDYADVTAQWLSGGNPAGAIYTLVAATSTDFGGITFTSATANLSATIGGLFSNTTYYLEVNAAVGGWGSDYTLLGSTVTDPPATSAGNTFYFRNIGDALISGYNMLIATEAPSAATDSQTSAATSQGNNLDPVFGGSGGYVTPAVGTGTLKAGVWTFNIHGDENDTNNPPGRQTFVAKVFKRTAGGSETALFISTYGPELASLTNTLYTWNYNQVVPYIVNPTDRLVVKLYAGSATGFTKRVGNLIDFYYDSTPSPSAVVTPFDFVAPSPVANLAAATSAGQGAVDLTWTAPGNDGPYNPLQAGSHFIIQYSTYVVNWSTAGAQVFIATAGVNPGDSEGYTINGLVGGSTYFLRLWTQDESLNYSALSNGATAMAQVPPTPGPGSPVFSFVGYSSVTAQWTANGNPANAVYTLEASTAANFTGTLLSSATAGLSATITGTLALTTYYFQVESTINGGNSAFRNLGSTIALPAPPAAGSPPLTMVGVASVTAQWSGGTNPTGTIYNLQASTASNFTGTLLASATANASGAVISLTGSTTYYLRVNAAGNGQASAFVSLGSTTTLVDPPAAGAPAITTVYIASVTAQWTSGNNAPGSIYNLQASTASDFSGTIVSSSTPGTSAAVLNLTGSTPYFLRVDAVISGASSAYTSLGSTTTLPDIPQAAAPSITAVYISSIFVQWNSGNNGSAASYNLQASTTSDFSGNPLTRVTSGLTLSSIGLMGNATYYLRVNASAAGRSSAYLSLGSTVTAADVPSPAASTFTAVYFSSITAQWGTDNSSGTIYTLQLSTASDFSGTVFSSATANTWATPTTLTPATTYYARVNAAGRTVSAYLTLGSTVTLPMAPLSVASTFTVVSISSVTAQWSANGNGPAAQYTLQASSASDFSFPIVSAITSAASGTVSPLLGVTTYYFRVMASAGGANSTFTLLGSTMTLFNPAVAPTIVIPPLTFVGYSSATAQWGAATNPAGTIYNLQASTAANFTGAFITSATANTTGTVFGLAGNTTYYFEANAVVGGAPSTFTILGSTLSLPAPPKALSTTFVTVNPTNAAVQWDPAGNSSGTIYNVQASTASDYTGTITASATANASATVSPLSGNQTYYFRVNATGNGQSSAFTPLGSTSTIVGTPLGGSPPIVSVFISSVSAQWTTGGNGAGTQYNLQASTAPDFSGSVLSSAAFGASATVLGLTGSTSYYFEVDAVVGGSSSPFTSLGSTVTLPGVPQSSPPGLTAVYVSSIAAQWASGGNGPLAVYTLRASTAANFTGTVFSSSTAGLSAKVFGLSGNGTYYFQVSAAAAGMTSAPLSLGATVTATDMPQPGAAAFAAVYFSSMTAQWTTDNAAGTQFAFQASTAPDFSGTLISSATGNMSATVAGLTPATTYYARVRAAGSSVSGFLILGSTFTQVIRPNSLAPTFNWVGISSASVQWTDGGNPVAPLFTLQASQDPAFAGGIVSSATANSNAVAINLLAGTTYYFRVKATVSGFNSDFSALGSTVTAPPAPAVGNTFYFRAQQDGNPLSYGVIRASETPTASVDSSHFVLTSAGPGDDVIYSYMSPQLGTGTLIAGTWAFNFWGLEQVAGTQATFKANVYTRDVNGVQTLQFSSIYGPELSTTKSLYTWNATPGALICNPTDRLVVQIAVTDATGLVRVQGNSVIFDFDSTSHNSNVGAPFDVTPPRAVADFSAAWSGFTNLTLSWTGPGNDGALGALPPGSEYLIQYSTYIVAWSSANAQVVVATGPAAALTAQGTTITGLASNTTYYLRLWTMDNVQNASGISNLLTAATLAPHASIAAVNVAPATANQGKRTALLKFTVTPGTNTANGLLWSSLTAQLTDPNSIPLTSAQAGMMFSSISLIAGSLASPTTGIYAANIDTEVVANVNSPVLDASGNQVLSVPAPAIPAATMYGQARIYYLVVQWASNAASQSPNASRANVQLGSGLAFKDASLNVPAVIDTAGSIASSTTTVIVPAASLAGWPATLGTSTASVEGGFVFATNSGVEYAGTDANSLVAFNTNGAIAWAFPTPYPVKTAPTDSCEGSGCGCDGVTLPFCPDYVYFADTGGNVYKVRDNGTSATQIWARALAGAANIVTSPAVVGDNTTPGTTVYMAAPDGKVHALNASTGLDISGWGFNTTGAVAFTGTPYVDNFTMGINSLFVGGQGGTMFRLGLADGSVVSSSGSANVAIYVTPNLDSGQYFAATNSNVLFWGDDNGVFHARTSANLTATPTNWTDFFVSPKAAIRSSPFLNRNETPRAIYFGCNNGKFYKLNAATGAEIWEVQTGGPVLTTPSPLPASFTGAPADYVYFGSDDGSVYGLNQTDGSARAGFPVNLGGAARSGPAYDPGTQTITVGSMDGRVVRINVGP